MDPPINQTLILADESAHWKIAGLRQLERIIFAVNEFAESNRSESKLEAMFLWKPGTVPAEYTLLKLPALKRCRFVTVKEELPVASAPIISTRLLVRRGGLARFLRVAPMFDPNTSGASQSVVWSRLNEDFENACQNALSPAGQDRRAEWRCLEAKNEILEGERWLLRGSAKEDDGFISRIFNRPLSRMVSRYLLKTDVTPNAWTLLILLLPLAACVFLSRGSYSGFVIGAALYQIHSMLDGCDGEIARAKYLDSKRGPGVDAFGDLAALLLFTLGLGTGLFKMAGVSEARWFFGGEAVLSFYLIANRLGRHALDLFVRGPAAVQSSEHDDLLRTSGHGLFGRRFTSFLFAITKRDVVFFAFLVLAILGLAPWILHLLFVYALGSSVLLLKGRIYHRDAVGA